MVKINFPFYPGQYESIWYCGKLSIDEINKFVVIDRIYLKSKIKIQDQELSIPPASPYVSTSSIDIELAKDLCDKDSNVLITRHHTRYKDIYIIIYLGPRDKGLYGIRFKSDKDEGIILGLSQDLSEKIYRNIRNQGKIKYIDKYGTKYFDIVSKISIDRIKTFPQVLYWPFYGSHLVPASSEDNLDHYLMSIDLVEILLGSLVLEKNKRFSYVFSFIPTPVLSAEYMNIRSRARNKSVDALKLPSINIYDVGSLLLKINLGDVVDKIYNCIYNMLLNANDLLSQINAKLGYSIELQGEKASQACEMDPKALLKALLNSFIFTGPVIGIPENVGQNINSELRKFLRGVQPHRLISLDVDLNIENTVFKQLNLIDSDLRSVTTRRSYVNLRRTEFIIRLFNKLHFIVEQIDNHSSIFTDMSHMILASYLMLLDDHIKEFLRRYSNVEKINIKVFSWLLAKKITLLLIEFGLHGISHLLIRYLSENLKIRKGRLNEVIATVIPRSNGSYTKSLYDAVGFTSKYFNIVIDGYHYRLRGYPGKVKEPTGIVMIFDTEPYSASYWREILKDFDPYEFAREMLEYLRDKNCYSYWNGRRERILPAIEAADSVVMSQLPDINRPVSKLVDKVSSLFGLKYVEKDPERLYQVLSLPLSEFRRILYHGIGGLIVDMLSKDYNIKDDKILVIARELHRNMKYYLNAIYEATLPFCFDGCYNCVLIEKSCSLKNPLLREWVVSRFMAEKILEAFLKSRYTSGQ